MLSFPTSAFQFERTRALRSHLYREARLAARRTILEVGAGEGRVAGEMAARTGRAVVALDLAPGPAVPGVLRVRGDAHRLPLPQGSVDAAALHFTLLWLKDPVEALAEARRVLGPGGALLILAEPDLTARVEDPDIGLGALLAGVVRGAGGHPEAGSRVGAWLGRAGFRPRLFETPRVPVAVEAPEELLHECDFLEAEGLDASRVRRRVRELYAGGGRLSVILPLTYGWAPREGGA